MKHSNALLRLLALFLVSVFALTGCGAAGELTEPYASELGELGDALLDQLIEDGIGAAEDTTAQTLLETTSTPDTTETAGAPKLDRDGSYTSRDDVALYLRTYGELPDNFITKEEARKLGWDSSKGNLHEVAPGKSIGGDNFGNYEGLLPKAPGRKYYECDIDYNGGYRNDKRIVYSNDGLIFYTDDHYASFTELK